MRRDGERRGLTVATARAAAPRVIVVTRVAAPRGLVLIEDSAGGEPPDTIPGQLVAATRTSWAIGCAADAATEITLGDIGLVPAWATTAAHEGRLATPTRKLAVRTVLGATLLEVTVPTAETRVRVWTNNPTAPTEITVGVEGVSGGIAK
jgi:hypothetical protein